MDVTIDLSDPVGSNAGQDDNNTEAMDHGGEPENTETETGVETMADVEEKVGFQSEQFSCESLKTPTFQNMEAPQFEPMPLNEEVVASDELHGENGQAERQSLEAQEATELDHIVENAVSGFVIGLYELGGSDEQVDWIICLLPLSDRSGAAECLPPDISGL